MNAEEELPVYSAAEISAIVLDFLTFLTTLHRDPGDLVIPPPGGWPSYTPEKCAGFKSDFAIEVLRSLPYLRNRTSDRMDSLGQINYKSHLLDYSTFDSAWFTNQEYLWSTDEDEDEAPVPDHVFVLAEGFESGGVALFLDVQEGRVIEETIQYQTCGEDLKKYFEDLKQKYRNLELIPCPGRDMMDSGAVDAELEKMGEALSEEEVLRQTDPFWGTDLDMLYTRQLYRAFGWPNDFRRDEAFREIKELIEKRET